MSKIPNNTQKRLRELALLSPPSRFLDYRHFFRHLKDAASQELQRYTYAQFSKDLGFRGSHVSYVLTNEVRKLSSTYRETIESTLRLPAVERKYLRTLVGYTHAIDHVERQRLFEKLLSIKSDALQSHSDKSYLRFFTDWRHAAIFELLEVEAFEENWEWISRQFFKVLTKEQIEESIQLLQDLGLALRSADGRLVKASAHISASETVMGLAKAGFHMRMMDEAKEALSLIPFDQREFGALTLSLSDAHYQRLIEDLVLFKRYAIKLSELSENKNRVVQFNFQLFPFTTGNDSRKESS